MPDFLTGPFADGPTAAPLLVLARLLGALVFGAGVAFVYRHTRPAADVLPSFTTTLVLLAVLIAMVTQVIGDNVARAFSLVGALSIVRFRTVVRDTQDTAYVIFAVAVGMASGASDVWVAVIGIAVVGLGALLLKAPPTTMAPAAELSFLLHVRMGLGHDVESVIGRTLDSHVVARRLVGMGTSKSGLAVDVSYRAGLASDRSADDLIKALNRIEGVHSVTLQRVEQNEAQI